MIRQFFCTAALACCSVIAQAGIVRDYFDELCARTEVEPMEMPAGQMPAKAGMDGAETIKIAPMTDDCNAKALDLAEGWDKSKLAVDLEEGNAAVKVFAGTAEDTGKAECIVMIKEADSPLTFIYVEGDAKLLESLKSVD